MSKYTDKELSVMANQMLQGSDSTMVDPRCMLIYQVLRQRTGLNKQQIFLELCKLAGVDSMDKDYKFIQ